MVYGGVPERTGMSYRKALTDDPDESSHPPDRNYRWNEDIRSVRCSPTIHHHIKSAHIRMIPTETECTSENCNKNQTEYSKPYLLLDRSENRLIHCGAPV